MQNSVFITTNYTILIYYHELHEFHEFLIALFLAQLIREIRELGSAAYSSKASLKNSLSKKLST